RRNASDARSSSPSVRNRFQPRSSQTNPRQGAAIMKRLPSLSTTALMAACLAGIGAPQASAADPVYTFHPFDVPPEAGDFTSPFGINNKGVIVGNFFSVDGFVDGFAFETDTFTYVTVPGSGFLRGFLNAVNDKGDAVGGFDDPDTGVVHSFLRDRNGRISI